jgi:hypothetical protein
MIQEGARQVDPMLWFELMHYNNMLYLLLCGAQPNHPVMVTPFEMLSGKKTNNTQNATKYHTCMAGGGAKVVIGAGAACCIGVPTTGMPGVVDP